MISWTWLASFQIDFDAIRKVRGVNHKPAVISSRNRDPCIEFNRGRHHQAIVVVRVLSDQVDAPRCTIKLHRSSMWQMEFVQPGRCFCDVHAPLVLLRGIDNQGVELRPARQPNAAMIKPNPSITKPHFRLTLIPSEAW